MILGLLNVIFFFLSEIARLHQDKVGPMGIVWDPPQFLCWEA